jgi:hypothetical protein
MMNSAEPGGRWRGGSAEAVPIRADQTWGLTMATPVQLRQLTTAQPFRPLLVRMASGRTFMIRHPENAACDERGRSMTVFEGEEMHLVEMLLVEELVPLASEQAPVPTDAEGPDGNAGR